MTAEMEGVHVQRDDVEARQTRSVSEDAMVDVEGAMGMGAAGGREEGRNGAGVSSNDNAVGWLDEMVNMCVGRASILLHYRKPSPFRRLCPMGWTRGARHASVFSPHADVSWCAETW